MFFDFFLPDAFSILNNISTLVLCHQKPQVSDMIQYPLLHINHIQCMAGITLNFCTQNWSLIWAVQQSPDDVTPG